jgi:hypothetical protein
MSQREVCSKKRYPTARSAKRVLHDLQRRRHGEERVYQCETCKHWHLTSQLRGWR